MEITDHVGGVVIVYATAFNIPRSFKHEPQWFFHDTMEGLRKNLFEGVTRQLKVPNGLNTIEPYLDLETFLKDEYSYVEPFWR